MVIQVMTEGNHPLHVDTVQYDDGDFKIVDHRAEKTIKVYDSLKPNPVAVYNYGTNYEMTQKEARIRGIEFAHGAVEYIDDGGE